MSPGSAAPSTAGAGTASPLGESPASFPIPDGTYRSDKKTAETLAAAGLTPKEVREVEANGQWHSYIVDGLRFDRGYWAAFDMPDGGANNDNDSGPYAVEARVLSLTDGDCTFRLYWKLDHRSLILTLKDNGCSSEPGLGDAEIRAFVATPFHRVEP
jgi:hypothetical protein